MTNHPSIQKYIDQGRAEAQDQIDELKEDFEIFKHSYHSLKAFSDIELFGELERRGLIKVPQGYGVAWAG